MILTLPTATPNSKLKNVSCQIEFLDSENFVVKDAFRIVAPIQAVEKYTDVLRNDLPQPYFRPGTANS